MTQPVLIPTLESFLTQALPVHLELLRRMVELNSFTANPQGVNALGELTAEIFVELGFSAEFIQADEFIYGRHLILRREGIGQDGREAPQIGLISHLDTVYPAAEEHDNDFRWRESGQRIYGPGVYDIKGGTVMIHLVLCALQALAPQLYESVTWIILLNAAEEALVPDFGQLCRDLLPENTLAALVFEGGQARSHDGDAVPLVVARKGMARYHIQVEGKAAHAGSAHAQGANAILQLAEVIQRIAGFTDYAQDLTFNVGSVAGGTVINRVPHLASASVEMRAFAPHVFAQAAGWMAALDGYSSVRSAAGGYPCRVQVNQLGEWAPWAPNEQSEGLLALWRAAGAELGLEVRGQERGGLSDGNWTWDRVPTMDGLGPEGGNAHCSERSEDGSKDQEYIFPASFVPKAQLNVLGIIKLLERAGHRVRL
jgi:glutamate carboxypeptidase